MPPARGIWRCRRVRVEISQKKKIKNTGGKVGKGKKKKAFDEAGGKNPIVSPPGKKDLPSTEAEEVNALKKKGSERGNSLGFEVRNCRLLSRKGNPRKASTEVYRRRVTEKTEREGGGSFPGKEKGPLEKRNRGSAAQKIRRGTRSPGEGRRRRRENDKNLASEKGEAANLPFKEKRIFEKGEPSRNGTRKEFRG